MTNEPTEEKQTNRLVIMVTDTMKDNLKDRAHAERRVMSDIVRDLIAEYLGKSVE